MDAALTSTYVGARRLTPPVSFIIGAIRRGLALAEPAGDAGACFVSGHHLVPELAGEKTDHGAHAGLDQFKRALSLAGCRPELQFAAIAGLPVGVEIEDDRDDPIDRPGMAVEVGFVERAFWIDGEVALELKQAKEKMLVSVSRKSSSLAR